MKRKSGAIVLVGLLAVLMAGRATTRGGGWTVSAIDENAKATFGFNLVCNAQTNTIQGQLEYHDHGTNVTYPNGVAVHGVIPKTPLDDAATCGMEPPDLPPGVAVFAGTYRPQADGLDVDCTTPDTCGIFIVFTVDNQEIIDCPKGGAILFALEGGLYDGYANMACLSGGNITVFN